MIISGDASLDDSDGREPGGPRCVNYTTRPCPVELAGICHLAETVKCSAYRMRVRGIECNDVSTLQLAVEFGYFVPD